MVSHNELLPQMALGHSDVYILPLYHTLPRNGLKMGHRARCKVYSHNILKDNFTEKVFMNLD